MLNRRKQIQKYTKILKKRRNHDINQLKNHDLLKHSLPIENFEAQISNNANQLQHKMEIEQDYEQVDSNHEDDCWHDSDGEQILDQYHLKQNRNKKITKELELKHQDLTFNNYQKKLGKFHEKKYNLLNWAQIPLDKQEVTVEQKDVNDFLNQEVLYGNTVNNIKKKEVKFMAKSFQKHNSVVTGLQWENNVMFTCGFDQKLMIFHVNQHQFDEKIKLQKQVFIKDLPLSRCYYNNNEVLMGTLHKNLVIVDTVKWTPKFITSNFLKGLKNYANLRVLKGTNRKCALFQNRKINIIDKNNIYIGSLLGNQQIQDFTFSQNDHNYAYSASAQAVYQWDLRMLQVSGISKKYLNFTCLEEASNGNLIMGSKLGSVYIYDIRTLFEPNALNTSIENNNLITNISNVSCNGSGTLAIAMSKWKSNAARVISLDNGRSIKDWPSATTKIGYGTVSKWSRNQNYQCFGVGSANGSIQTYFIDSQ